MEATDNFRKHTNKNPLQKFLISLFYKNVFSLINDFKFENILDVGAGEGFTLKKIKQMKIGKKLEGIEYNKKAIELSKKINPDIKIKQGSIFKLPYRSNSFDLVICTEVLEHVENPEKALGELVRVSKKYLLLSVPNEPFFMMAQLARGKNWSRLGNDIEHINHWSFLGFQKFVGNHIKVQSVSIPFFWTIVFGIKKM